MMVRNIIVAAAILSLGWAPPEGAPRGKSTTVQLPAFGVSIDAEGILSLKMHQDPTGRLHQQRLEAARRTLPDDVARQSALRKVSLVRLEKALAERITKGEKPNEAMQHLAGLLRVEYVFCLPEERDIILAGPAEGWVADAAGRVVGWMSGLPTLRLDDLTVALRAYPPGGGERRFIGCTIDPTADGLAKLAAFQRTIPSRVSTRDKGRVARYVAEGTHDALGMAQIRTWGVPPGSHFAHVMVEADYRMKRIGIGLEPPPVKMATFLSLIRTGQHSTLERWWFTPEYKCVRISDDRLAAGLEGQGVKLQTEHMVIGPGGVLLKQATTNKASELFCTAFTAKYPEIAARSPVFAQLRGLIDLVIAAALVQREAYYAKTGWAQGVLSDETALPVDTGKVMKQVPAAVNALWKGNRLLSPAGGGVSINAHLALEADQLLSDASGEVQKAREETKAAIPAGAWWWD